MELSKKLQAFCKRTVDICETSSRFHLDGESAVYLSAKGKILLFADLGINTQSHLWVSVWVLVGALKLTGGSCPAANIHVILVVKLYANSFSIPG